VAGETPSPCFSAITLEPTGSSVEHIHQQLPEESRAVDFALLIPFQIQIS